MKNYESLVDALPDVKRRGYTEDFEIMHDELFCRALDLRFHPEEFTVDEIYRFEENSDPDDNSILYLISSSEGVKGFLLDAYGTYAENMSFEMAKKLRQYYVW